MNDKINRYGAYGLLQKEGYLFFTLKKSGPFKGLWGLPGGGIEYGETPEETLKRELLEEAALDAGQLELQGIVSTNGTYSRDGKTQDFYFIGIVYKVLNSLPVPDLLPEEEGRWIKLTAINPDELTPFAKQILCL